MHFARRRTHGDLDLRQSPQTWIYSDVVDTLIERNDTIYSYVRSGTLVGMSTNEFFKHINTYAPYKVYCSINGSTEKKVFTNAERSIIIDAEVYKRGRNTLKGHVHIVANDKYFIRDLGVLLKKHLVNNKGNTVYCIGQGSQGLVLQDIGTINDELARDNYDQEILKKADYVVEQINSDNPNGRLTIINGLPGTGKTHLIKGLIPQIKYALIILLPTRLITEVDGPALVSLLAEWKDEYGYDVQTGQSNNPAIVLILEDADDCLTTRNDANMSTVSSVLNHTDGIFGSMLDLRLIATTNAHHIEFDRAFTRPGRLCTHITIDKLTPEHAMEVYKRITGGKERKYLKHPTLAEVYADAIDNPHGFIKEDNRMGFK